MLRPAALSTALHMFKQCNGMHTPYVLCSPVLISGFASYFPGTNFVAMMCIVKSQSQQHETYSKHWTDKYGYGLVALLPQAEQ